jgi:hypothetical protein
MDVSGQDVTRDGCLNLQLLREKLKALPDQAVIRRYTSDFDIEKHKDAANAPRANFSAVSAFAHFQYSEAAARLALNPAQSGPFVILDQGEQRDCNAVTIRNPIAGERVLRIVSTKSPNKIELESDERERVVFTLNSPRELQIEVDSAEIDFCPSYEKARIREKLVQSWGKASDLDLVPLTISTTYLKKMTLAVTEMPQALSYLISQASDESISVTRADLSDLALAPLDRKLQVCPYRATPPSGEEPPPPSDPAPATPSSSTPAHEHP